MLERFKDCLCNPKYIGKYNKDKFGKIFINIILFFLLSVSIIAVRCYTENPLSNDVATNFTSMVIKNGSSDVAYDSLNHKLTGSSYKMSSNGFILIVLPNENDVIALNFDYITVILAEDTANLYYDNQKISSLKYNEMSSKDFKFDNISCNQIVDINHFQSFIDEIFASGRTMFQTFNFIDSIFTSIVYYILCVFFCYIFSIGLNPTIERKVRAKLCFYDSCVFFACQFFAYLFNSELLIYLALMLPIIYSFITFRHIIRVIVKKEDL